jgi:excisionase family DNA binding protein
MVDWKSVPQIAAYLGVSKETVYRWLDRKQIPCHRVGKLWKFDPEEVDKAIKKGRLKSVN